MSADWLGLTGRTAVVTGAAMGIGKAVVQAFAEVGMNTVVADVNAEAGEATVAELNAIGGRHLFVSTDVTSTESAAALAKAALEAFGQIDVLVNNAGIAVPRLLIDPAGEEEMSGEIWDRLAGINEKGMFLVAQAVGRDMVARGCGVILNMASESGLEGSEGQSAYSASKAVAYSLTRSWGKELAKHGVRVVGMAPGILESTGIRTPAYDRSLAYTRGKTPEEMEGSYGFSGIPLGRPGTLAEIADVACFLVSDRAAYVHGTVLNVSGGKSRA